MQYNTKRSDKLKKPKNYFNVPSNLYKQISRAKDNNKIDKAAAEKKNLQCLELFELPKEISTYYQGNHAMLQWFYCAMVKW